MDCRGQFSAQGLLRNSNALKRLIELLLESTISMMQRYQQKRLPKGQPFFDMKESC